MGDGGGQLAQFREARPLRFHALAAGHAGGARKAPGLLRQHRAEEFGDPAGPGRRRFPSGQPRLPRAVPPGGARQTGPLPGRWRGAFHLHGDGCAEARGQQASGGFGECDGALRPGQFRPPRREVGGRNSATGIDEALRQAPRRPAERQESHRRRRAGQPRECPRVARRLRQDERHQRDAERGARHQHGPDQRPPRPGVHHQHAVAQDPVDQDHRVERQAQQRPRVQVEAQRRYAVARHAQEAPGGGGHDGNHLPPDRPARPQGGAQQHAVPSGGEQAPDEARRPAHRVRHGDQRDAREGFEGAGTEHQGEQRGARAERVGGRDDPGRGPDAGEGHREVQERRRGQGRGGEQRKREPLRVRPEPSRQLVARDPDRHAQQEQHEEAHARHAPVGPGPEQPREGHAAGEREGEGDVDGHGQAGTVRRWSTGADHPRGCKRSMRRSGPGCLPRLTVGTDRPQRRPMESGA